MVHAEGDALVHREDLQGPMPPVPEASQMPLSRALRGVSSTLAGPSTYQRPPDSGIAVEQRRLFEATGIHSAVIAPIRSTRAVLGALTLGRAETPADFTPADLPLLETSPAGPGWPSTTPVSTSVSARSLRPCRTTCCPRCRSCRAWR